MEFIFNSFKFTIVMAVMVLVTLAVNALTNFTILQIVGGYAALCVAALVFALYENFFRLMMVGASFAFIFLMIMAGMKII